MPYKGCPFTILLEVFDTALFPLTLFSVILRILYADDQ